MFIDIQNTPNPNTLKFILSDHILPHGTAYQFTSKEDAKKSNLATKLFEIEEVSSVFIGYDFVSVTINNEAVWDSLKPKVLAYIQDVVSSGDAIVGNTEDVASGFNIDKLSDEDKKVVAKLQELFDERIRPAVAMDGGDIIFRDYKDGIVYLTMHGACSGCPSSTVTLKSGIENMLKYYIPEVKEVVNLD